MSAPRRSWLPWIALLAIAAAGAAWLWREPPREVRTTAPIEPAALDAGADASIEEPPARAAARAAAPEPPPVSAAAPPTCPDDEPDPPGWVRPSVSELLRVRTEELRDRLPQLSRDASPALREGLDALNGDDPDGALDRLLRAPDRVRDGFDVAIAARLHVATRALSEGDLRRADRHSRAAVRADPEDPVAHALASIVADRLEDSAAARDAMVAAHGLVPDEPALALAAARELATAARFEEAVRAADLYVHAIPGDTLARRWRDRMAERDELTRGHARRRAAGIEIAWPSGALSIERVDAVLALLRTTLDHVARATRHERRAELAVVVYADRDAMRRATCAPSWTGGVFDGVLHLDAGTLARAGWERVVRHEGTHAQLARVRGAIPHWLNEGLAQWMEGEPSPQATGAWRRMVRDRFWIPFASLEGRLMDIDDAGDASLAYFQSLAMVLYLIDSRGERAIADAAARIEAGEHTDLLDRLVRGAGGDSLLAYLARRSP